MPEEGEISNRIESGILLDKLVDKMIQSTTISNEVVMYEIPDDIFTGGYVDVDGKKYSIYDVPRIRNGDSGIGGHSLVIGKVLERYIRERGTPTWSQVITESFDNANGDLETQPKVLFVAQASSEKK